MAYNKKGYYLRARLIKEITAQYYEPENHAKCYKMVWKKYIYPRFGICYRTYLKYMKVQEPQPKQDTQLKIHFTDPINP